MNVPPSLMSCSRVIPGSVRLEGHPRFGLLNRPCSTCIDTSEHLAAFFPSKERKDGCGMGWLVLCERTGQYRCLPFTVLQERLRLTCQTNWAWVPFGRWRSG